MNKIQICQKILNYFNQIPYGVWNEKLYTKNKLTDEVFLTKWFLLTPKQIIINNGGICWDISRAIHLYLNKLNIQNIQLYCQMDNKEKASHSFNVAIINNKYYIIDGSWKKFKLITECLTIKDVCYIMAKRMFKQHKNTRKIKFMILQNKPKYGCDCLEYMNVANSNKTLFKFKKID